MEYPIQENTLIICLNVDYGEVMPLDSRRQRRRQVEPGGPGSLNWLERCPICQKVASMIPS